MRRLEGACVHAAGGPNVNYPHEICQRLNKTEAKIRSGFSGGRGGIRTHGTVTRTPDFESGAFDQLSHPSVDLENREGKIS